MVRCEEDRHIFDKSFLECLLEVYKGVKALRPLCMYGWKELRRFGMLCDESIAFFFFFGVGDGGGWWVGLGRERGIDADRIQWKEA